MVYDQKAPEITQNVTRNVTLSPVIPRCFSTFFERGYIPWTSQVPPEPIASGNTIWSRSVSTLYRYPERSLSHAPVLLRQLRSLVRKRNRCYRRPMTAALAHIIDEIERLSVPERIELRRHLAKRIPMTGDLTEDDFATIAAETFSLLDSEEVTSRRG